MSRALRRWTIAAALLVLLAVLLVEGSGYVGRHPQDFPWTRLDLDQRAGRFTGTKLAALADDPRRCRALLARAGSRDRAAPPLIAPPPCGYADGMMLVPQTADAPAYRPAGLITACPVAAALAMWERDVVRPAARRYFGQPIVAIDHAGSYSCRHIAGQSAFSEHSTADAIDIMSFRLRDGRTVSVRSNWHGGAAEAAFLHRVRDGACGLFSTVLSPDYNRAHADHLHFDQASRGAWGWRACR